MARTARAQGPALPVWLRRLALGLIVLQLALAAWLVWRMAVLAPYSDEIDWIQRWRDLQVSGDWAHYLLSPHNLHRQPWTFGLIALDIQAFGGTNLPLILSAALAVGAMAWLLARAAAQAAPPPLALPTAALATLLALAPWNLLDAATPICADYTHGAVFAVLALVLAEGGPAGARWRRAAALGAAMAAGLGDAVALAVWPALAFGAAQRRDWRWLTAVLVTGGVFVGLYLFGPGAQHGGETGGALSDPLRAVRLALTFLALPWARLALGLAWIGGLAVGGVGLAAVLARGGREAAPPERTATAFILFSLGAAAMAGLGRAGVPDALNVPLRYALLLAPLHVGLLMLAAPCAGVLWRASRPVGQGLVAAALLLALAQNLAAAPVLVRITDAYREAIAEFRAGRPSPQAAVYVHPDLARAEAAYAWCDRTRLFQHELHLKRPPPAR